MKIAFIGDSFCASKNSKAWTELVAAQLGATVLCRGQSGASLWSAWQQLCVHIQDMDAAVLCYTDAFRLPNPRDYPINLGSVQYHRRGEHDSHGVTNFPDRSIWDAADAYYQHLFVAEYHQLVHGLIIEKMDAMLAERGIPAVHFFGFDHYDITFSSGPCCDTSIWDWLQSCGKTNIAHDTDENHMSWPQNQHAADRICQLLKDRSTGSFTLDRVRYNR
jgi:hypothetical protein